MGQPVWIHNNAPGTANCLRKDWPVRPQDLASRAASFGALLIRAQPHLASGPISKVTARHGSRNISICGLLLEAASLIPRHTPVSFTVTVNHNELGRRIQLVRESREGRPQTGRTTSLSRLSVKGRSLQPTLIPQLEFEVDSRLYSFFFPSSIARAACNSLRVAGSTLG